MTKTPGSVKNTSAVAGWKGIGFARRLLRKGKEQNMNKAENNTVRERLSEPQPSTDMAEQIQRALDMMKRVRAVNAEQPERTPGESTGNKYVLPEPLVFHVGTAS